MLITCLLCTFNHKAGNALFLQEYVVDGDTPQNQIKRFFINGPINITEPLKGQLKKRDQQTPFVLEDGVILTNIYFQPSMQGYFDIPILVNDTTPGHGTTAKVSVSKIWVMNIN